jgi:hypothetical protein
VLGCQIGSRLFPVQFKNEEAMVSEERRRRAEIKKRAAQRAEAVWTCVNVLRPDLPLHERKDLARHFLDLGREDYVKPKPIQISPAQVSEIVWLHFQCANRYCSALLFSELIAEELNEFFAQR